MVDTVESLNIELQNEKRKNSKLLDLLMSVKRGLPDGTGRIDDLIDQATQTKQCLDRSQDMIDCELVFNGCSSPDLCKARGKCVQRSMKLESLKMTKNQEVRAKCAERMARLAGCAPRADDSEIKDLFLKLVDEIIRAEKR